METIIQTQRSKNKTRISNQSIFIGDYSHYILTNFKSSAIVDVKYKSIQSLSKSKEILSEVIKEIKFQNPECAYIAITDLLNKTPSHTILVGSEEEMTFWFSKNHAMWEIAITDLNDSMDYTTISTILSQKYQSTALQLPLDKINSKIQKSKLFQTNKQDDFYKFKRNHEALLFIK
jgi:hypothetical protein